MVTMKARTGLSYVGLACAVASCMPMMWLGLLGLAGVAGAGAAHSSMAGMSGMGSPAPAHGFLGTIAAVINPVAQPLEIVSLALLVATAWQDGRVVFGLTALLSVFMWMVGRPVLSWTALGLLVLLRIGVAIREARAMRCGRQAGDVAALTHAPGHTAS